MYWDLEDIMAYDTTVDVISNTIPFKQMPLWAAEPLARNLMLQIQTPQLINKQNLDELQASCRSIKEQYYFKFIGILFKFMEFDDRFKALMLKVILDNYRHLGNDY